MPVFPGPQDILVDADPPIAGDGSALAPLSIPAATNAVVQL
jgi:hypothetical protein